MPIKFKENQTVREKASGKKHTQRFFMRSTPIGELVSTYTGRNCQPKLRQKIRNEFVRRKVEIPAIAE
ncbi:MAG: hypothetical protein ACKVJK_01615 [Methylophagaceae bacterium]|jgi:hypothetical protein|tara:strand:- start:1028 stop:1231 length:204 start_codon:yes stop_codon:yes gene_type:complete